jgi:hypothetical protein
MIKYSLVFRSCGVIHPHQLALFVAAKTELGQVNGYSEYKPLHKLPRAVLKMNAEEALALPMMDTLKKEALADLKMKLEKLLIELEEGMTDE